MGNNLIKLTTSDDKKIIINSMLIESIEEVEDGSYITMGFASNHYYRVNETPEEVVKKIDKSGFFKTTTYSNIFEKL